MAGSAGSRKSGFAADRRAISNVIGYAITFALISMTVSLIILTGVPAVLEGQQGQADENAAVAFEVLQENLNGIHSHGNPGSTTTIGASSGTLRVNRGSTVSVNDTATGFPDVNDADLGSIIYEGSSGAEVAYENGMVAKTASERSPETDSYVSSAPPLAVTNTTVFVPVVTLRPDGGNFVSGTSARVRTGNVQRGVAYSGETEAVNVTVDSRHASAWEDTFESLSTPDHVETVIDRSPGGEETVRLTVRRTDGGDLRVLVYRTEMGVSLSV